MFCSYPNQDLFSEIHLTAYNVQSEGFSQNHWASGLCPLSGIQILENTTFRKLALSLSSGKRTETPTSTGRLIED
jgi:hypothetical protein